MTALEIGVCCEPSKQSAEPEVRARGVVQSSIVSGLPPECLLCIVMLLDCRSIGQLLRTCHLFLGLSKEEGIWRALLPRLLPSICCNGLGFPANSVNISWLQQCRDALSPKWDKSSCGSYIRLSGHLVTKNNRNDFGSVLLAGPCPPVVNFRTFGGRHDPPSVFVGIIPLADFDPDRLQCGEVGWSLYFGDGELYSASTDVISYIGSSVPDVACASMLFDAVKCQLSYIIDGVPYGIAFENVAGADLRMFVSLGGDTCVELS